MFEKPPEIHAALVEVLNTDSTFDYVKTKGAAIVQRGDDLLAYHMFPWLFFELFPITITAPFRMPQNWNYELTVPLVALTMADRGDMNSLIVNDGTNNLKGIGDIVKDIGTLFWTYQHSHFGVSGINKWTFGRVGAPTVMHIQTLLQHPYIRGVQVDFVFDVSERSDL